jgi:hypothetical protein
MQLGRFMQAATAAALAFAVGCSGTTTGCHLIGCESGLTVQGLAAGSEVCVDGKCAPVQADFAGRFPIDRSRKTHTVTSGDRRFEGPIVFTKFEPNGKGCGPTCYVATLVVATGGFRQG